MKNKIRNMKGFTLVELLIVIALIAILSVAVLATINPIEQSNKARDAKFMNDASEMVSAYERYYTSQNVYPWNVGVGVSIAPSVTKAAFISRDARFGVLGIGGSANGELIRTYELKSAFAGKEPFADTSAVGTEDVMYLYHDGDSNYVCFCPKSNTNRTGKNGENLKCLTGVATENALPIPTPVLLNIGAGCSEPNLDSADFCAIGGVSANLMCAPQGDVR